MGGLGGFPAGGLPSTTGLDGFFLGLNSELLTGEEDFFFFFSGFGLSGVLLRLLKVGRHHMLGVSDPGEAIPYSKQEDTIGSINVGLFAQFQLNYNHVHVEWR